MNIVGFIDGHLNNNVKMTKLYNCVTTLNLSHTDQK